MLLLRRIAEFLFEAPFTIARIACFAQAVAFAGAGGFAGLIGSQGDLPAWARIAGSRAALLFVTFLATAVVLQWLAWRRAGNPPAEAAQAEASPPARESPRSVWFVPTLAALAAITAWQSASLLALWRDIATLGKQLGPWDLSGAAAQYSGFVLAPIFVLLYVPALEALAALIMIVPPLALLGLIALRSPSIPRLYFLMAACQAGLVLSGLVASDLFLRLSGELTPELLEAGDDFGPRVVAELHRGATILRSTALAFLAPLAGYLAWVPALLREQSARR